MLLRSCATSLPAMSDLGVLDRRMSAAEGLMWRLENDPFLSSAFANVTILDRRPDMDRLLRRIDRASIAFPRLRQRVQPTPANLGARCGSTTRRSICDYHVRHIALPRPASMRQLLDLASLIAVDPFDRTRPLWQFWIVDGLPGASRRSCRRCTTRSSTARAASSCRSSTSTSSATRTRAAAAHRHGDPTAERGTERRRRDDARADVG